MQKASVGLERAKETEKDLKKEQKRAERAEKENVQHLQSLKEVQAEVEMLKGENADQRRRSEEAEHNLREQLAAAEAKAEAEYDRAVLVVTDNYRGQMPAVKDAIWGMAWRKCLTKLGVDESSPLWTNMELPSEASAEHVQPEHTDLGTGSQSHSETPPEPLVDQPLIEAATPEEIATEVLGDNNSITVTNAGQHGEEA